ncbi:MAG: apolipoprotein N-acyltransferase [Deltaproteobacteria bacterium]|nr:apolipoprotein N-acyltransferase [Deltaproteobacteria bacterium]
MPAAFLTAALLVLAAPGVLSSRLAALFAWVAFFPLLVHLPKVTLVRAAFLGWLAGVVTTLGACAWFPGLLARFSGLHPLVCVLVVFAIAAWQAAGWAAWAVLVRVASGAAGSSDGSHPGIRRLRAALTFVLPAAAFVVFERWLPVIFPSSVGITQYRFPVLAQSAELGGPYVPAFLCLLFSTVLARAFAAARGSRGLPGGAISGFFALLVVLLVFGLVRLRGIDRERGAAPRFRVAAVQAGVVKTGWNTPPDDPQRLGRYQRLSAEAERDARAVDLLVWPEKAYPFPLRSDARHDYRPDDKHRIRRGFRSPLLFGATAVDPISRRLSNSGFLLLPDGGLRDVYDKVRLIFYSERFPSWLSWLASPRTGYLPGSKFDPAPAAAPLAVFICFEATFPDHVRALVARGGRLLVNLSDDSWFGESAEPEQHLAHAVFRAIESRRDLVRATGSGVSAHVSAAGEILGRTRLNRYASEADVVLVADARLLDRRSFYAALGDAFCWLCVAFVVTGLVVTRCRLPILRSSRPDRERETTDGHR